MILRRYWPMLIAVPLSAHTGIAVAQSAQDDVLDEITVTATKRPERILDVPLSITALSAEDIERRGVVSSEDYLRGIPGVSQVRDGVGQTIIIRGIETTTSNQNYSSGTTVATYFGETPTTNTAGLGGGTNVDIKLVDIERVEVLRGPQGTAFGNSSLGGAVRTLPAGPRLDVLEGRVSANYSVTSGSGGGNNMVQGMANVPLIADRLAIRAVGYRFDDTGFYRGTAASDPDTLGLAALYGIEDRLSNEDHIGDATSRGGRIAALFQATDDLKVTFSFLTQKSAHWPEQRCNQRRVRPGSIARRARACPDQRRADEGSPEFRHRPRQRHPRVRPRLGEPRGDLLAHRQRRTVDLAGELRAALLGRAERAP